MVLKTNKPSQCGLIGVIPGREGKALSAWFGIIASACLSMAGVFRALLEFAGNAGWFGIIASACLSMAGVFRALLEFAGHAAGEQAHALDWTLLGIVRCFGI